MTKENSNSRSELLSKGEIALREDVLLDISAIARKLGFSGRVAITFEAYQSYVRTPKPYPWINDMSILHDLLTTLKTARKEQPMAVCFEFPFWIWTTNRGSMETQVLAIFQKRRTAALRITIAKPTECRVMTMY